jgi:hypothetical protein
MIMRYHWGLAVGHAYAHGNLNVDPSRSTDGASHRDEDEHMDAGESMVIPEDEQEGGCAIILESNEEGGSVVILDNKEEGTDDESGDDLDKEMQVTLVMRRRGMTTTTNNLHYSRCMESLKTLNTISKDGCVTVCSSC